MSVLKKYIKESISRIMNVSPEELSGKAGTRKLRHIDGSARDIDAIVDSSKVQSEMMAQPIKNYTGKSVKEYDILKILANSVGDNTFITFKGRIEYNDKGQAVLTVGKDVIWGDFQGLFSYNLSQQNLMNLVSKRKPTSAGFATAAPYFCVYKINSNKALSFSDKDNGTNVKFPHNFYPLNDEKLIDQIEEAVRITFTLIDQEKLTAVLANILDNKEANQVYRLSKMLPLIMFFGKQNNKTISKNKRILAQTLFKRFTNNKNKSARSRFYEQNYSLLYHDTLRWAIGKLAILIGQINNSTDAQYGSILWHSIGIDHMIDSGTGSIHGNELSQAVSFDFTGKSIIPIGMFNNIFKDKQESYYYNTLLDVIENENINWDYDITTYSFDDISEPRAWDMKYLKKMLKKYPPSECETNEDIWYFWNDTMEGALWSFSEHLDGPDEGLKLLNYILAANIPELKEKALRYKNEILERVNS